MNKYKAEATGSSGKEIVIKGSANTDSESASSESDDGESEEEEEGPVGEPNEGTGAPNRAYSGLGFDLVGHPESSPPHQFPTPPPDAGSKMGARKTTLRSEILSAINGLGNKTGSSVQAIVKYMKSNGHEVPDQRRFSVQVRRSLKMSIRNGQVEQVKLSYRLTKDANNKRRSVEKLKAHKAESKAKEKAKEKESKAMAKKEAKEAKLNAKANAKATKEKSSKEKAPKKGTSGKAAAGMTDSKAGKMPLDASSTAKNTKPKPKRARKSIGTLAQPQAKPKVNAKAVKQLVAGKGKGKDVAEDLGETLDANVVEAQATSTPNVVGKGKATRKRK